MSSQGSLELLQATTLSQEQQDLIQTISSSNSVLTTLVEDILQLIKYEHENTHDTSEKIYNQPVGLMATLDNLKRIVSGYANQFSVCIDFQVDEAIENLVVISNRHKIQQFLSNLLTNAVKASKKNDHVELIVKREEISADQVEVSFQVKDFGCGIPKSKFKSIFEPFTQLHNVNESTVPG